MTSLTWAASEIFSSMVRGVPGVAKTLNRVPELRKAQEGNAQHLLEDPDVVIQGNRVLHLRYRVHR